MIRWYKLPDELPVEPSKDLIAISVNGEIERTTFHYGSFWTSEELMVMDGYYTHWTYGDFPPEYAGCQIARD